jgi:hypothetical protein
LFAVWLFDDTKMGGAAGIHGGLSFFGRVGAGIGKDEWFLVFGACARFQSRLARGSNLARAEDAVHKKITVKHLENRCFQFFCFTVIKTWAKSALKNP